jgi:hypothetical protein
MLCFKLNTLDVMLNLITLLKSFHFISHSQKQLILNVMLGSRLCLVYVWEFGRKHESLPKTKISRDNNDTN